MGVGASLYMYACRRKKVHVRYLISWWVSCTNGRPKTEASLS